MKSSTRLLRLTQTLILGAVVAGTAATVANALPVVDVGDAVGTQSNVSTQQGVKADGLRLQGIAHAYQQSQAGSFSTSQGLRADGLRLQGIAHAYPQSQPALDVLERFAASHPYGAGLRTVSPTSSSRFDWGDYAIGIGSGMGLILVLAGGLAMGLHRRHSVQTA